MKSVCKYSVLLLFATLLLFSVVLFRRHINNDYQTAKQSVVTEDGEEYEAALLRGIAAVQIEQAMAERRVLPLKPFVMPKEASVSNKTKNILIVASWRTGSSFLGDIILSAPGVFYSYEPLTFKAYPGRKIDLIRELFQCRFRSDYLRHINGQNPESVEFVSRNRRVWESCSKDRSLCTSPEFVRRLCVHFPVQLIKVVRLRLSELMRTEALPPNLKVIYLVRDPRGVMASRSNLTWCQTDPECNDPARLCDSVVDDLKVMSKLKEEEPGRFYMLRFEDLAANVEAETKRLFKFLDMPITVPVKVFLSTHTRAGHPANDTLDERKDPFSTRRQSNTVAHEWRKKLPKHKIKSISKVCANVLHYLNYTL